MEAAVVLVFLVGAALGYFIGHSKANKEVIDASGRSGGGSRGNEPPKERL